MIYFTELENLPTYDAKGEYLGKLIDLGIDPSQNALRVASYLVSGGSPKNGSGSTGTLGQGQGPIAHCH